MQHKSSEKLYDYWNEVRDGGFAPDRFEIEPVKIADILPDVFILECHDSSTYHFRLAGTRLCSALGHELRGYNMLDYWAGDDREAVQSLLHNVVKDGAGAVMELSCGNGDRERAVFEMILLPLVHRGRTVNRILGCAGALNLPYWLGSIELTELHLTSFELIWPAMTPTQQPSVMPEEPAVLAYRNTPASVVMDRRKRFHVVEGGLSKNLN